ncbi:MAG: glycoside hydrolase family 125 protein [Bryobacteraceae bacterium]|nr:glycoside hydrolase family 125 protein [Bryobacteraceae bacterium]
MSSRREFLQSAAAVSAAAALPGFLSANEAFRSQRPPIDKRKFVSDAVEAKIVEIKKTIADPEMGWLFENCFPNTLDTTVQAGTLDGKPDTFVITGDIDAMWLRDSTAQVWPYLPLTKGDAKLKALIAGVIRRQTRCVLIDPYANAFNFGPTGSEWDKDRTQMKPELHERKWEIDSLCYPIRLAHGYWKTTGDASLFDQSWQDAAALTVKTFREQQRFHGHGPYSFQRLTEVPSDSMPLSGYGNPARPCGLIHSGFRPSDDACIFPYLIPSNFFAATSLEQLAEIFEAELPDKAFAKECRALAAQVREALAKHAAAHHPEYGQIYAYEADGYGNHLFMDDSNIPSLLAMPYLGSCTVADPVYRATRAFVLSEDNPYYFRGKAAAGAGGPHSGLGMIWPLAITVQALTSQSEPEIAACLKTLKSTHAGTGFMHESFSKDDPKNYTRPWFAWANTLFGELILTVHQKHPRLLA